MNETDASTAPAIEKARQLFRFLKAFAERGNPPKRLLSEQQWTLRLADCPVHPDVVVGRVDLAVTGEATVPDNTSTDGSPLLRVRRPEKAPPPRVPQILLAWLEAGWDNPGSVPRVIRERNELRNGETFTVLFTESSERVAAFEIWRAAWERWAVAERPVRATIQLFERLFELRGRIKLESESLELMLGDGRLRWRRGDGEIDHPIVLQRVELEFDSDANEMRINDSDRAPELLTTMLQGNDGITADTMTGLRQELEQAGYHPLNGDATSAFVKRIVRLLSPRGVFRDDSAPVASGPDPVASRDAVLFLRQRASGFPAAFDWVVEDLEKRGELPISLTRLVGVTPPTPQYHAPESRSPWGEPPDVLLSKPANPEQVEIARALDRHHAVLVQGPPGTGKSHTIANLIGHLVAQGKRVLVTSHTTKALSVLRDQIEESLRPLTVAVLETDMVARTQMEQSVKGILSRLTTAHEPTLEREVADLASARAHLNGEIDRLTVQLCEARDAEYLPIVIAGESIAPADAARWVRENIQGNDWIPGPIEGGAPLPLSSDEISELYGLASRITGEEEHEIARGLPDAAILPSSAEFDASVQSLAAVEAPEQSRYWERPATELELTALEDLTRLAGDLAAEVSACQPWQRALIAIGHANGAERDLWLALQTQVNEAQSRWDKARPILLDHQPEVLPSAPTEETRRTLGEIVGHLESGGSLGTFGFLLHPSWKALKQQCRVNGQQPETIAHFRALGTRLVLDDGRRKLAQRWSLQAEPIGLPSYSTCGSTPEPVLRQYADQFLTLMELWPTRWRTVVAAMRSAGLRWEHFRAQQIAKSGPVAPFEMDVAILSGSLKEHVSARLELASKDRAETRLSASSKELEPYRGWVCGMLSKSIRERDAVGFHAARERFLDLADRTAVWQRRRELLEKLKTVAPRWSRAIGERTGPGAGAASPGC